MVLGKSDIKKLADLVSDIARNRDVIDGVFKSSISKDFEVSADMVMEMQKNMDNLKGLKEKLLALKAELIITNPRPTGTSTFIVLKAQELQYYYHPRRKKRAHSGGRIPRMASCYIRSVH